MILDFRQMRRDRLLAQLSLVFPVAAATASAGTALVAGLTGLVVSVAATGAAAWYAKNVRGQLRQTVSPKALQQFLGVLFAALLTGLLNTLVASLIPFSIPAILLSTLFLFLHLCSGPVETAPGTGHVLLRMLVPAGIMTLLLLLIGMGREALFNGSLFAASLSTDPLAMALRPAIGWIVAGLVFALWRILFTIKRKEEPDHAAV